MHRSALFTTLLLACGEKGTSSTDAASTTTDATTAIPTTTTTSDPLPTTSEASTGTSTTTTTSETSTGTSATSEPPPPIRGEWLGTYTTGFGFARFRACGEDDGWPIEDGLPYFNECTQAPLWLRVQGTTTVMGNFTSLTVTAILAGPCTLGSCDGTTPLDACDSFDVLCAP